MAAGRHARQRFERSDVPTASRGRTAGAIVALVLVALLGFLLVRFLWEHAQEDSTMGDAELASALDEAADPERETDLARSDDEFENVLFLIVSDASASSPELASARLACLDVTAGRGFLVSLPQGMRLASGEGTLAELVASQGEAAAVGAVADACGLPVSHVVVVDQAGYDAIFEVAASGTQDLVGAASELLSSMRTDMGPGDLVSLAETLQGIGISNLSAVDAPLAGDRATVDADALGVAVGYLVP